MGRVQGRQLAEEVFPVKRLLIISLVCRSNFAASRLSVQRLCRPLLREASDRITPGGAGGVAERDGRSIAMN